jgi:hypothetical protein
MSRISWTPDKPGAHLLNVKFFGYIYGDNVAVVRYDHDLECWLLQMKWEEHPTGYETCKQSMLAAEDVALATSKAHG